MIEVAVPSGAKRERSDREVGSGGSQGRSRRTRLADGDSGRWELSSGCGPRRQGLVLYILRLPRC